LIVKYLNGRTIVSRYQPADLSKRARQIVKRVSNTTKQFGIHAIPKFVLVPPAGNGYHSGSSMPIGGDYVKHSGELRQNHNIFIVDATSLPEINAGSHTFTAMANAFRIAKGAK
jgi:choline dehydrogenase-like flavoprotein